MKADPGERANATKNTKDKQLVATAEEEPQQELGTCSVAQLKKWLREKRGSASFPRNDPSRGRRKRAAERRLSPGGAAEVARPHQAGSTTAGIPDQKETKQWFRNEKGPMEKDVGDLLGEFAQLSQELPKGDMKERTVRLYITTIPGKIPV